MRFTGRVKLYIPSLLCPSQRYPVPCLSPEIETPPKVLAYPFRHAAEGQHHLDSFRKFKEAGNFALSQRFPLCRLRVRIPAP